MNWVEMNNQSLKKSDVGLYMSGKGRSNQSRSENRRQTAAAHLFLRLFMGEYRGFKIKPPPWGKRAVYIQMSMHQEGGTQTTGNAKS
jgi:hypothetical protein